MNSKNTKTPAKKTSSKVETNYTRVTNNVYKTGSSYRVRVGKLSMYCTSKTAAIKQRNIWKELLAN